MNIDITVTNRNLTNSGLNTIPSGSCNDCYVKFLFIPGYGWETVDSITAVFSRSDTVAYHVYVPKDTYIPIPASVLHKPGNLFISLIGTKGDNRVLTTGTLAFVIEYNSLSILCQNVPAPLNSDNTLDIDAYAQYVAAVNSAANRAEEAARKAESIAYNGYTKEESDARYARRVYNTFHAKELFNSSYAVEDTYPTVKIAAIPPINMEGSISNPAPFHCIQEVIVKMYNTETVDTPDIYGYNSLNLRYLSSINRDYIEICKNGCTRYNIVEEVKLQDTSGVWTTPTTYEIPIGTYREVNLAYAEEALCNIGHVPMSFTNTSITLELPPGTSEEELNNIIVWYPTKFYTTTTISTDGLGSIPPGISTISCTKIINEVASPVSSFYVSMEIDISKYLNLCYNIYTKLIEELKNKADRSDLDNYVKKSEIGKTIPSLVDGKIPIEQLPDNIGSGGSDSGVYVKTVNNIRPDILGNVNIPPQFDVKVLGDSEI